MGQGVEWVTFQFSLPCVTSAGQAAGSIAPHCSVLHLVHLVQR